MASARKREMPFLSPVFSWHNPKPEILESAASQEQVAGLINAYSVRFTRDVIYCADSNMRHPTEKFLELVSTRQESALQLLFHPLIWVIGGRRMAAVLAQAWPSLIREQEHELRGNNRYHELFPAGMPQSVLTEFTESLLSEMDDKHQP